MSALGDAPGFDDRPPIPDPELGPLASGSVRRALGVAPLSVLPVRELARQEAAYRSWIGDDNDRAGGDASIPSAGLVAFLVEAYTQPDDLIVDPFAGGATRGVVAAALGRWYLGVDMRAEQVEKTNARFRALGLSGLARVEHADAATFRWPDVGPAQAMISSPPYWDVEVYSDDPDDLSAAATYEEFLRRLGGIVKALRPALARDAFAAWVLGRVIHKGTGELLSLPDHAEVLFRTHGFRAHDRIEVPRQQPPTVGGFGKRRRTTNAHESVVVARYLPDDGPEATP